MTTDRYTRIVLTVIAASLAVDAGSRIFAIPAAWAATKMDCKITDPVKVEGTLKLDTFGGNALQIKAPDALPIKAQDPIPTKAVRN